MRALRWPIGRRCAACGIAAGDPLCLDCEADFFPQASRCARCALPLPSAAPMCGRCLADEPHFDQTVALTDYEAPVDGMVAALKFAARLDLADVFGGMLARRAPPAAEALVVPVPLSADRLAERGYNQALLIARACCRALGAERPQQSVLRVRHHPPQQSLPLAERRRNVRGVFTVAPASRSAIAQRTVWVIDDVMTSGSTVDEMARVLKVAGAARVVVLVVARTR